MLAKPEKSEAKAIKNPTPWALFVLEQRAIYARTHKVSETKPEERKPFRVIMRMLAQKWKSMSEEEKQPYYEQYAVNK